MSRHVSRRERWSRAGAASYRCPGALVRSWKGGWYAWVGYHLADPAVPAWQLPVWLPCHDRLGPFRRPRNAMIAAEERLTLLGRRHGDRVRLELEVVQPQDVLLPPPPPAQ